MIDGLPNPPLRFEQDPESPDGTGTFHFQDGSSLYAHEPELASAVREREPKKDERTAENAHRKPNGADWADPDLWKDDPRQARDFQPGVWSTSPEGGKPVYLPPVPARAAQGAPAMPADFTQGGGELGGMPAPAPPPPAAPPPDPAAAAALMQRLGQGQPAPAGPPAPAPPPRQY